MKKISALILALMLLVLSVPSLAETDYTIINLNMTTLSGIMGEVGKDYYKTARESYNKKVKYPKIYYAEAAIFVLYDIFQQFPDLEINLNSALFENTVYMGYCDKDNYNELIFFYYSASGKFYMAEYLVGERALILINDPLTSSQMEYILENICSAYTAVPNDNYMEMALRTCGMVEKSLDQVKK